MRGALRVMLLFMLVGAGLLSGIGAGGPAVAQAAIEIGTNSCIGVDACLNASGPIGDNSCNGDYACAYSTLSTSDNSCNAYRACYDAEYSVGAGSCNGYEACIGARASIGADSCNFEDACGHVAGSVSAGSCNEYAACVLAVGTIGDNSCNDGEYACWHIAASVGNNSCNGFAACYDAGYSVGNYSCTGNEACWPLSGAVGDCQRNDVTPAACAAPQTTIDSGPTGTVSATSATFTFSSSLPGSTFECSLDGAAFSACSTPRTYTDLAIGAHTFAVRAIEGNNNIDPTPASTSWTIAIPYGNFNPTHVCATGTASVSLLGIELTPNSADRWVLQRVWVYSTANGGSWTASDYYMAQFNAQGTEPQAFYRWTGSAWLDGSSHYDVTIEQGTSAAFYVQSWWYEADTWEGPYGAWAPDPATSTYWCGYNGPQSRRLSVTDLKLPRHSKLNRAPSVPIVHLASRPAVHSGAAAPQPAGHGCASPGP